MASLPPSLPSSLYSFLSFPFFLPSFCLFCSFLSPVIQPSYIFKVFFFAIILAVCSKSLFDSLMTPLFLNIAILDRHEIILLSSWVVFVLSPAKRVDEKKGENGYFQLLLDWSPLFSLVLDSASRFLCFPALRKHIRCQIWKIVKAVVVSACPFTEIK